ncbi:MAG: four helix bundle protein [Wenzhouxiangella sp.]
MGERNEIDRRTRKAFRPAHFQLDVWRDGVVLGSTVCRMTKRFPRQLQFSLGLQMQRAAISVPSNIAEGAARGSPTEFRRFLKIARSSLMELDTQIRIADKLGLLEESERILEEIQCLNARLNGLLRSL